MKNRRIAIATPIDPNNFGNRLQNYAVHEICKKLKLEPVTLISVPQLKKIAAIYLIDKFKLVNIFSVDKRVKILKMIKGLRFTLRHIKTRPFCGRSQYKSISKYFEYAGLGGDQIFSQYWINRVDFCDYSGMKGDRKICFAPSIGNAILSEAEKNGLNKVIKDIDKMAVREFSAKAIVEEITGQTCQVVLDPVLMLDASEWHKLSSKINNIPERYILVYMFSKDEMYEKKITVYAEQLDAEIINVMSISNSEHYVIDPGEFIYLIENASVVCTDSYHGVLMAMIFYKPYVIFTRNTEGADAMNTRFETLDKLFGITSRYHEQIKMDELCDYNYQVVSRIKQEREAAWNYYYSIIS